MPIVLIKGLTREEVKALKQLKLNMEAETWREFVKRLADVSLSPLDRIPASKRWEIVTNLLTRAVTLYTDFIKENMGWRGFYESGERVWSIVGRELASLANVLEVDKEDASRVHEVIMSITKLAWGPEIEFDVVEATKLKSVARVVGCPWRRRMLELGVQSFCEPHHELHEAFLRSIVKAINPRMTFRFTRDYPYCEQAVEFESARIFEKEPLMQSG